MSFRQLLSDIEEISSLLVISHASSGKSIAITRNNQHFSNLSAKSTLNEWTPRHQIVQSALLDVVGSGDGGKLGAFMTISMIRSLAKHKHGGHPDLTKEVISHLDKVLESISEKAVESKKEHLISVGEELDFADQLADAVFLGGAETHISLERYGGTGCEVIESESLLTEARPLHISEQVSLKGSMVALLPNRASNFKDIADPLELMGTFPNRPLVIIAPMMRGEALATIKRNRDEGVVEVYGVEAPLVTWGKGWLEDVASFTGGTLYDPFLHSEFKPHMFGSAREITLKDKEMIIDPYDDHAEVTAKRISQLLYEAKNSPHSHTQDLWRKRAASLGGTLIRVKVGGATETEARLRRNKAEKAMLSMGMMLDGGHVEGAIPTLSEIQGIHPIIDKALVAPLRVVAINKRLNTLDQAKKCSTRLYEPFPLTRLLSLVRSSFSTATMICSIARIINKR